MIAHRRARGAAALVTRLVRPRRGRLAVARVATEDPARIARILVVKPHDQLGDLVLAGPALDTLRVRHPHARITLVTRAYLAPVARRLAALDEVRVLPRASAPRDVARGLATFSAVASLRPELAFVLNSVSRSRTADLVAALSGAAVVVGRSVVGAGLLPPRDRTAPPQPPPADPVYDLDVPIRPGSFHQVSRLLDLVRAFDVPVGQPPGPPRLRLEAGARDAARAALAATAGPPAAGDGPWIALHPAAANPLKCWPVASFVELAARVAQSHPAARLFVLDTPKDPGPAHQVHAGLAARGVTATLVPPADLDAFIPLLAAFDLVACNDSGVLHLAAAVGGRTLSFHSLGRPEEWAPQSEAAIALHAERIAAIGVDAAGKAALRLLRTVP